MLVEQVVPEGLAALPPGPELARLLGSVDPGQVPNDDVVDLLVAQSRQLAHEQARMLAVLAEVICRRPFAGPGEIRRGGGPEPHAADEVRAALTWTRRAAERETDFAHTLVHHLPQVHRALSEGRIDRGKAWVFAQHLADLTRVQIDAVCAALLPLAARLTTGQLGERLRRMVLELDPDYYQRRYRRSVRERRVICYLDVDGTATLTGAGLPADEAAAAIERVDTLARAARRAGHPGTLDQIRADLVLGLLDGSMHGLTRDQIVDALIARYASGDIGSDLAIVGGTETTGTAADPGGGGAGACGAGPDDGWAGTGRDGHVGSGALGTPPADRGAKGTTGGSGGTGGDTAGSGRAGLSPHGSTAPVDPVTAPAAAGPVPVPAPVPAPSASSSGFSAVPASPVAPASPAAPAAPDEDQRVGVEIRAPLTSLVGLDERAGELPGLGPVTADTARRTVARQRRAQWRWVVVDAEGRPVSEGITRRRPVGMSSDGPGGGIVELQVSEADLADLMADLARDPASHGAWAAVITDVAGRHEEHDPAERTRDLDADPDRRFPGADLRRHVQVRDRTCVHPGCRATARHADLDHTRDHHRGGPTTSGDLAPLCRHDHMLKTDGGWQLYQPRPGRFVWISPLGREYPVVPEPILPPAIDQVRRARDPSFDDPAEDADHPLTLPTGERAPPPHDPHNPTTCEPPSGPAPNRHAHDHPDGARTDEDPPPF